MKRILIATNQYIVNAGIAAILLSKIEQIIIDYADNYEEIFYKIKQCNYHIIILDNEIIRNTSKNIISELKKIRCSLRIIIYTSYISHTTVQSIYKGSEGFLNKYAKKDEIILVITNALDKNEVSLHPAHINFTYESCPLKKLSWRELQIFNLLVKGHNNVSISTILNIKMSTVSTYKSRIFEKLEINTIAELISIKNLL